MDGLQAELMEQLEVKTRFTLFGVLPIPDSVFVTWIIMAFLVLLSILLTRHMSKVPKKPQLVAELFVGFINNFAKNNIGKHWRVFAPYLGTVGLYIGCANLIGMFGLTPPTKDLNVTAALAIMSTFLIYGANFRYNGLRGGLKTFAEPMPLLVPINVLEIVIRPLSLCMRLFGNVLGAFIVMELIKAVLPVIVPIPLSLYFDVFDGIIQTIVFVFLTTLFTREVLE